MTSSAAARHERYVYDGLGGSAVAAVLGLSRYTTRRQLYERIVADLDGTADEWRDNRFTWWGRHLEDAIAEAFTLRTGLKLRKPKKTYRHPRYPFLVAHVDRMGYGFVFEAKTASEYADGFGETISLDEITPELWRDGAWRERVSDDVPDEYALQLQHYMELTKKPIAFLTVLIGGSDARLYRVEHDHELYTEAVLPELVRFWRDHVEKRVPPELTGDDEALVRRRFPRDEDEELVIASAEIEAAMESYSTASMNVRQAEAAKKAAQARIEEAIGEHTGVIGSTYKATWKRSKDSIETAWELVAKAYREALTAAISAAGGELLLPNEEGEELPIDTDWLDVMESLHAGVKEGSRRFSLGPVKKGESE